MRESTFFETLFVFLLLHWKTTQCDPDVFRAIATREIFYNEDITTILNLQSVGVVSNTEKLHELMNEQPNIAYTALECKYSDAIVELLQSFFEINEYGINAARPIAEIGQKTQTPGVKKVIGKWLVSSINHFHGIKAPIARILDDLFSYSEQHAVLKTSDQSLLKSLLSINLFLYHSVNDGPFRNERQSDDVKSDSDFDKFIRNVRRLDRSIVRMIGSVERFRHRRCVVRDPYKNNYKVQKEIHDSWTPLINDSKNVAHLLRDSLKDLSDLSSVANNRESVDTNKAEYDPKHLLLNDVLDHNSSFLEKLRARSNGDDLLTKYFEAKRTCDVADVLEFQYCLIDVIADVFYGRIYGIATDGGDAEDAKTVLEELDDNFDKFISNVLPSTCSVRACNGIIKSYYFFRRVRKNDDRVTRSETYRLLREKFKPDTQSKESVYRIVQQEFAADDPGLGSMCRSLLTSVSNGSFARVFRLLAHEPHANGDFHVVQTFDDRPRPTRPIDANFVSNMVELQCALFTFRTMIKKTAADDQRWTRTENLTYDPDFDLRNFVAVEAIYPVMTDRARADRADEWPEIQRKKLNKYGTIVANMLRVVVRVYESFIDSPDVRNILLPLLIRLRHADRFACDRFDFDSQAMSQMSFVTVVVIENYLIANDLFPFCGLFVYSKLVACGGNGGRSASSCFRDRIRSYLESDVPLGPFTESLKYLNVVYDGKLYEDLFSRDDKEIRYYWNGRDLIGYKIFLNLQRAVIDANDLIAFQWFGVKWLVGKFLLRVKKALSLLVNKTKTETRNDVRVLTAKLNELLRQELPTPLRAFLDGLVRATVKLLNATSAPPLFDFEFCNKLDDLYEENFEALGLKLATEHLVRYTRIDEIVTLLDSDAFNLKMFLKMPFLGAQHTLNSTELVLSPSVATAFSDASVRVLFDCE